MWPLVLASNALLFLLVFGMAAAVDIDSFKTRLKQKAGILVGLVCQFILLPFIGFCTVALFGTSVPKEVVSEWIATKVEANMVLSILWRLECIHCSATEPHTSAPAEP